MGAFQRAGLLAFSLAAAGASGACSSNNGSEEPGPLAGNPGGEGATETNATRPVCSADDPCPDGVACIYPDPDAGVGQCEIDDPTLDDPSAGGAAGGTCLAGSGDCEDLGPADEPLSEVSGGQCLPGTECDDLEVVEDEAALGLAGGTCLAGSGECDGLGPADAPVGAASGTCLAGSGECGGLGPADGPGTGAPGLCEKDADCPDGRCIIEPGDGTGVCES